MSSNASGKPAPIVCISVVTWNSEAYITACLRSINRQTFRDFSVTVVDNTSSDHTVDIVKKFHDVSLIQNSHNSGYSAAHNRVISSSSSLFILCLNPDVILDARYLESLVRAAHYHPDSGSFGGKVYRTERVDGELTKTYIDAAGMMMHPTGRVTNRGEGEHERGQYDAEQNVFGHPGTAVLYRRAALESVRWRDEYFDEDFFAYKEDADIAWRLRRAGLGARYVPSAIAWHVRALRSHTPRRKRDLRLSQLSLRNHWLMLVKNINGKSVLRLALIIPLEMVKVVFYALVQPRVLHAIPEAIHLLPRIRSKR